MIDRKKRPPMGVVVLMALFITFAGTAIGIAAEAHNVRLVGYSDLQARPSLQNVLKGDFAYVGHHSGTAINPPSGKRETNGTSIVNVSYPSQPKIVRHIPGYAGSESRAVQVVENFYEGRDFLLRNQESGEFTGFEVWDITDRSHPALISTIAPLEVAHKSWWESKTGMAYLSGTWPGWHGRHLIIYDLNDPYRPKFIANWGFPMHGTASPSIMTIH